MEEDHESRISRLERVVAYHFDLDFNLLKQLMHQVLLMATIVLKMGLGLTRHFVEPQNDGDMFLSAILYPLGCPAIFLDGMHAPLNVGRRFLPRICGYPLVLSEFFRRFVVGEWLSYVLMDYLEMTPLRASVIGLLTAEILTNDLTLWVIPFAAFVALLYPDQEVHVGIPMFLLSMILTGGAERLGLRKQFSKPRFGESPRLRRMAYIAAVLMVWALQMGLMPLPNYFASFEVLAERVLTPEVWHAGPGSPVHHQARRAAAAGRRPMH